MTTIAKMPDCRVVPTKVGEMQVGDSGYIGTTGVAVLRHTKKTFVSALAPLSPVCGDVWIERQQDGYHIRVCEPEYRWNTVEDFRCSVYPVRSIKTACPV